LLQYDRERPRTIHYIIILYSIARSLLSDDMSNGCLCFVAIIYFFLLPLNGSVRARIIRAFKPRTFTTPTSPPPPPPPQPFILFFNGNYHSILSHILYCNNTTNNNSICELLCARSDDDDDDDDRTDPARERVLL